MEQGLKELLSIKKKQNSVIIHCNANPAVERHWRRNAIEVAQKRSNLILESDSSIGLGKDADNIFTLEVTLNQIIS